MRAVCSASMVSNASFFSSDAFVGLLWWSGEVGEWTGVASRLDGQVVWDVWWCMLEVRACSRDGVALRKAIKLMTGCFPSAEQHRGGRVYSR